LFNEFPHYKEHAGMRRHELCHVLDSQYRTASAEALQEQLRHVYWIGGGSSAGKSTVARRIAAEHGLQLYATDDVMTDHAKRGTPGDCPLLHKFMAMDMDQRWLNRSPQDMLETFHWFRGEGFSMIIEDVLRLPRKPGVIVEGFRLLPHLVEPLLAVRTQALWLLPTREFRQAVVDNRGPQWGFIGKTSNPDRALRNLLERDAMFTDRLYEEAQRLGLNTFAVDSTMTVDELTGRVVDALGL
jgi:2-phosphoglycerate kinase